MFENIPFLKVCQSTLLQKGFHFFLADLKIDENKVNTHGNMRKNSRVHTPADVFLCLWTHTLRPEAVTGFESDLSLLPAHMEGGSAEERQRMLRWLNLLQKRVLLSRCGALVRGYRPSRPPTSNTLASTLLSQGSRCKALWQALNELNARSDCHSNDLLGNKQVWRADTADRSAILTDQRNMILTLPHGLLLVLVCFLSTS